MINRWVWSIRDVGYNGWPAWFKSNWSIGHFFGTTHCVIERTGIDMIPLVQNYFLHNFPVFFLHTSFLFCLCSCGVGKPPSAVVIADPTGHGFRRVCARPILRYSANFTPRVHLRVSRVPAFPQHQQSWPTHSLTVHCE